MEIDHPTNNNNEIPLIQYTKKKNSTKLFTKFANDKNIRVTNTQHFIPIFSRFFEMSDNNWQLLTLKDQHPLVDILSSSPDEKIMAKIRDSCDGVVDREGADSDSDGRTTLVKEIFIKYSPLLDPYQYILGHYDRELAFYSKKNKNNGGGDGSSTTSITELPNPSITNPTKCSKKLADVNNSAYIDGFFIYLSSSLLNKYNFIHGIDHHGSYLGLQENFRFDISDDFEYIHTNDYFLQRKDRHENDGANDCSGAKFSVPHFDSFKQYWGTMEKEEEDEIGGDDPNNNSSSNNSNSKPKINIENDDDNQILFDMEIEEVNDQIQQELFDGVFDTSQQEDAEDARQQFAREIIEEELIMMIDDDSGDYENNMDDADMDDGDMDDSEFDEEDAEDEHDDEEDDNDDQFVTGYDFNKHIQEYFEDVNMDKNYCDSSISSEMDEGGEKEEEEEEENSTTTSYSTIDEDEDEDEDKKCFVYIKEFPVQMICMEKCEDTLENYLSRNLDDISDEEVLAIFMQVIMTLLTYNKAFDLVHNDLHTCNVVYHYTDAKFIRYIYEGITYQVPTFGKIYKIIDFGRATYKFAGRTMFSASYSKHGDAWTQYNCPPYYNPNKPVVEPNPSFDLCRFACSLFDFFVGYSFDFIEYGSEVTRLILDWCNDDHGQNIMFKEDCSERYPKFALYNMIARTVHRHTARAQLDRPEFIRYKVSPDAAASAEDESCASIVVNIDLIPSFL